MSTPQELPAEISFEAWISHIFDHDDPDWHWKADAPSWDEASNRAIALNHLDRLFSEPAFLIERFTPNQIGTGLAFLVNGALSQYGFVFLDYRLSIDQRTRCLRNIATVYESVFTKICSNMKQHGRSSSPPELKIVDGICFMFWDVFGLYGRTRSDRRDEPNIKENWNDNCQIEAACLDAMERTLAIDHLSCQEAALHGLGHWQMYYPDRVVPIIDRYLASDITKPELAQYAQNARRGEIL